jgi:hypothetical protein
MRINTQSINKLSNLLKLNLLPQFFPIKKEQTSLSNEKKREKSSIYKEFNELRKIN